MADKDQTHVQRLRGTVEQNDAYTGLDGELTINQTTQSIRLHDGVTPGGFGTEYGRHYEEDELPDVPPTDLHIGALVTVGDGNIKGGDEVDVRMSTGEITYGGDEFTFDLVKNQKNNYTIDANFPLNSERFAASTKNRQESEALLSKLPSGSIIIEGTEAPYKLLQIEDGVLVEKTVYETEVYAAHSDSEESSEELAELMPDGGIIIERSDDAKPVLKQVVNGQLVATELSIDDSSFVHTSGDETIDGAKSFVGGFDFTRESPTLFINDTSYERDSTPESVTVRRPLMSKDKDGKIDWYITRLNKTNGARSALITLMKQENGGVQEASIGITQEADGSGYGVAPTAPANSNSDHIANTKWVRDNIDANVVHKTGDETVAGVKTFTADIIDKSLNVDATHADVRTESSPIRFRDKNDLGMADIRAIVEPNNISRLRIMTTNQQIDTPVNASLSLVVDADGNPCGTVNTPLATSKGDEIATAKWVRDNIDANVVHKTGNETIEGLKTFTGDVTSNTRFLLSVPNFDETNWTDAQEKGTFRTTTKDGVITFDVREYGTQDSHLTRIARNVKFADGATVAPALVIGADANKVKFTRTNCLPAADSNSEDIATTAWVRANIDSNAVHKTGNETVEGLKTFTSQLITTAGIAIEERNDAVDLAVAPDAVAITYPIRVVDKNGKRYAITQTRQTPEKVTEHNMFVFNNAGQAASLSLAVTDDGKAYASTVTPDADSNADHIATTKWVRENIDANVVHKTGNETIDGTKTFSGALRQQRDNPYIQMVDTVYDTSVARETQRVVRPICLVDSAGKDNVSLTYSHSTGDLQMRSATLRLHSHDGKEAFIGVKQYADGTGCGRATTPPANASTDEIPTVSWVRDKIKYGTNDIGAGAALDTGAIYLVYEE